jgi:hypothetical protein
VKAFAAIFFIFIVFAIFAPKEAMPMDLTQFQWKNRLLFLFAPDRNNQAYKDLQAEISDQKTEVQDRDLVVFEVLEQEPSRMDTAPIDREGADALRDRFRVPPNTFSLILVGKDGGIKLKRHDEGNSKEIFDLIDSMPMRQNEMRQKNQ